MIQRLCPVAQQTHRASAIRQGIAAQDYGTSRTYEKGQAEPFNWSQYLSQD